MYMRKSGSPRSEDRPQNFHSLRCGKAIVPIFILLLPLFSTKHVANKRANLKSYLAHKKEECMIIDSYIQIQVSTIIIFFHNFMFHFSSLINRTPNAS